MTDFKSIINKRNLLDYFRASQLIIANSSDFEGETLAFSVEQFCGAFEIKGEYSQKSLLLTPGFFSILSEIQKFISENLDNNGSSMLLDLKVNNILAAQDVNNSYVVIGASYEKVQLPEVFYEVDPFVLLGGLRTHMVLLYSRFVVLDS